LTGQFNDEELQGIAFDMDINYDELPGDTLTTRSIAMVRLAQHRGTIERLKALILKLRPDTHV